MKRIQIDVDFVEDGDVSVDLDELSWSIAESLSGQGCQVHKTDVRLDGGTTTTLYTPHTHTETIYNEVEDIEDGG